MRLSETQKQAIIESVRTAFGPAAKTYLFGSRIDDRKYGGDIDLLVEVPMPNSEWLEPTLRAVSLIQRRIGERKIDLVVTDGSPERESELIVRKAREGGVLL